MSGGDSILNNKQKIILTCVYAADGSFDVLLAFLLQ